MGKNTSGTALQEEKHICTQGLAKERVGTLSIHGWGVRDSHHGPRGPGGQEGGLEERALDLLQMRLPELQVAAGNEGGADGIVKDVLHTKLSNDAGLVVGHAQFFSHLMTSLGWKDVRGFYGSERERKINSEKKKHIKTNCNISIC